MYNERYKTVEEWSEKDITEIPDEENDIYEFKSSRILKDKLKERISIAASAFWNSGGGALIVGVDDQGKIDGGIPFTIGKQKLRDWVDQAVSLTEPVGPYVVKIIKRESNSSLIENEKVILVVSFGESYNGPHMALDKKYYIRAGAHSGPASHFLVESIRSRKGLDKPLLQGMIKSSDNNMDVQQLIIFAINDAVALDVNVSLDPLPKILEKEFKDRFPLVIPVIDKRYPFSMDISIFGAREQLFGEKPIKLRLSYKDIVGRIYSYSCLIDPKRSTAPMRVGRDIRYEIKKAIESISSEIKRFRV